MTRRTSSTSAGSTRARVRVSCTATSCATSATIPAIAARVPRRADRDVPRASRRAAHRIRRLRRARQRARRNPRARPTVVLRVLLDDPHRSIRGGPARAWSRPAATCSSVMPSAAERRSRTAVPRSSRRALHELVTDPVRADTLGDRGRAYVAEHYGWDVVMDRYERLLHDVVRRVDQDRRSIFTGSGGVPIDLLRGGVAMTCRRGERSM